MICTSSKKSDLLQHTLSADNASISIEFYEAIDDVPHWDSLAPQNSLLLKRDFLKGIENCPPSGTCFIYIVFTKNGKRIGIAYTQVKHFNAKESIQAEVESQGFFQKINNKIKNSLANRMDFDALVLGNLLLTGNHGYHFLAGALNEADTFLVLRDGINQAIDIFEKKHGRKISAVLCKDYENKDRKATGQLLNANYSEFQIQPSMAMDLDPSWKTFEDYQAAMLSKYRVRSKRAAKKGVLLKVEELSEDLLRLYRGRMFELYDKISANAGFNVIRLGETYFLSLKEQLGDRFKVFGYFDGEELVGYHTLILNEKELEAHFLGFDPAYNPKAQIYLNMLYNMIRYGIEEGNYHRIVFARTALEIKSSVGAVPHEMFCYLRHKNNVSNKLFKQILNFLEPKTEWQQRHPFKAKEEKE